MDTHEPQQGQGEALPFNQNQAFNRLLTRYHGTLAGVAKKHRQQPLTLDECYGEAMIGLLKAAESHGYAFLEEDPKAEAVVRVCIENQLIDFKRVFFKFERLQARTVTATCSGFGEDHAEAAFFVDIAEGLGLTDASASKMVSDPTTFILRGEALQSVRARITQLNEAQRDLIRSRFYEGNTLAEVAGRFGVTTSAVHAAEKRALSLLSGELSQTLIEHLSA